MSGKTKIEWADRVWNPVVGCTPVSEGCRNCYAKRIYERFHPEDKFANIKCLPEKLDVIRHWRLPKRIFVNSMSDLFHPDIPDEFIMDVFDTMTRGNRRHTYLILTKRPDRMKSWFEKYQEKFWHYHAPNEPQREYVMAPWPDPCIWLGVSVEDQKTADERIPLLLQTPAAKRFVSVEPMIGQVDLRRGIYSMPPDGKPRGTSIDGIDWVICGGESGPGARPMHPDWARSLRDQCQAAGVPFFFKQWGEWTTQPGSVDLSNRKQTYSDNNVFSRVGKKNAGNLLDGKVWVEFPEVKQ